MTNMMLCSIADGRVLAANNNKHLTVGGRQAIIRHNSWVSTVTGEVHQVGLDFLSAVSTSSGTASEQSQEIILRLFAGLG